MKVFSWSSVLTFVANAKFYNRSLELHIANMRVSAGLVFVSPKFSHREFRLQCWVPLIKIIGFFKINICLCNI
jgi:hypothetical protein